MKVNTINNCKVYNITSNKNIPLFLSSKKKRELSKNDEYSKRIELIQDFNMETSTQIIKQSNNNEHIIISGIYPPIIKCYNVYDMSLKFQRGLTSEVINFECLSNDYSKIVFLQNDRNLNFHAPYGTHYNIRIPKFGRDLKYNYNTCDLFISSNSDEIYRLNLELGTFKESLLLSYNGCNKLSLNSSHPLLACGGQGGICEFWDLRNRSPVSKMKLNSDIDITALNFDTDGLTLGMGTSNGNCIIYDIRSSIPLYTKEHQYGVPIIDISYHHDSGNIISTDKKIVKIWKRSGGQMGQIVTNIEPTSDINSILPVNDQRGSTGLFFLACETSKIQSYFIPSLGPAPRWCSFLENITEELEEKSSTDPNNNTVYEDYKFLTKTELEEINGLNLIGTSVLRSYMHGYFIDMNLYNKLRAISKPFEYNEYKQKKINEKLEEKRKSRINIQQRKQLPKYNKELAEKILTKTNNLQIDDRFSQLFNREEFQQNPNSDEFKLRNPTKSKPKADNYDSENDDLNSDNETNDMFQRVQLSDNDDNNNDNDNNNNSDYDSDDSIGMNQIRYKNDHYDDSDDNNNNNNNNSSNKKTKKNKKNSKNNNKNEDDGEIISKTKQLLKKKETNNNNNNNNNNKVKMYSLTNELSNKNVLFLHSNEEKEKRKLNKIKQNEILTNRLNKQQNEQQAQQISNNNNSNSSNNSNIKLIKTSEGIVREYSYFPTKEASNEDRLEKRKLRNEDEIYGAEIQETKKTKSSGNNKKISKRK